MNNDQTCVVCILFAHFTLLPPDDPDDDDAVVVFDVFRSSLKFDFMAVGLAVLRCWRNNELFSSVNWKKNKIIKDLIKERSKSTPNSKVNVTIYLPALLIMKSISLGTRRFRGNPYAGISWSSSSSSSSESK